MDGFPDLIGTFEKVNGKSYPQIMLNSPCGSVGGDCAIRGMNWNQERGYASLQGYDDLIYAFPYDIDDDAVDDILLVREDPKTQITRVECLYNNIIKDSFYLKMLMTTKNNYGSVDLGSSFRAVITSLDEVKFTMIATQLPTQSGFNLQSPMVQMSVGRSNNYIEDFTVSKISNVSPLLPLIQIHRKNDPSISGLPSSLTQDWS